jgi:predicted ATPase
MDRFPIGSLMLKKITLLRERVEDWSTYPFSVPTIASLPEIALNSRVVFFAGENGTGKSTLLEAVAAHYGFGPEGGNRNFSSNTTDSNHSIDPLTRALRLSFDKRTGAGFFLRAESFFNTASAIDNLGVQDGFGDRSLHAQSHGESFFTLPFISSSATVFSCSTSPRPRSPPAPTRVPRPHPRHLAHP